jgi:hypothetical protein
MLFINTHAQNDCRRTDGFVNLRYLVASTMHVYIIEYSFISLDHAVSLINHDTFDNNKIVQIVQFFKSQENVTLDRINLDLPRFVYG